MRKLFFSIGLVVWLFVPAFCQSYSTSADIYLGLKKLNTLGSVLYIAAHPDDENTRLLTYFSKDKLYRTGYLSLTRGDGGQNLIGDEQGVDLGLIRTQELLAARQIDGAEQFFTRAYDFGYSKNPEETFTHWNKEMLLADVVWVIRKFQPDVIITRFPAQKAEDHGQHTASAILANEAFTAAADPKRFPEQLKYVQPWQAKRILWNGWIGYGGLSTSDFHFDVGGYNPVLGKSYGEIAAESRSQHKTQGFGVPKTRGEVLEYFKTTGGRVPQNDLFDEVNTTWARVSGSSNVESLINEAIGSFDFSAPHKSVGKLVNIYKELRQLPKNYWGEQKLKELTGLIEAASGLWMEAFTTQPYAVQGDSLKITFLANDRLGVGAKLEGVAVDYYDTLMHSRLIENRNLLFSKTMSVPVTKQVTQPYWLKNKMTEGAYNVSEQLLIGQPDIEPAYSVAFRLSINGEPLTFIHKVQYKFTDPVKGELYEPVYVIPPLTVSASPHVLLFESNQQKNKDILVQVNANANISGSSQIKAKSAGYDLSLPDPNFSINKNGFKNYSLTLQQKGADISSTESIYPDVRFVVDRRDMEMDQTMRSIDYAHIPSIRYFYKDSVKVASINLNIYGKKIGYITGAGDKVPEALEQMGYEVTLLNEKDLARINLQSFDAIIAGVRAYNTNTWLYRYYDKLMQYVSNGGNYIVQYNQYQYNQPDPALQKIGPYNFSLSLKRITDERSTVSFLKPDHPVLNYPNKITADDFKGWIQERSIYHPVKLDPHYETILRMNDPDEQPEDGSLIIAPYGRGYFTYTGLVFFRELPAGVPGAYRLLANIIALNRKKEF